MTRRRHRTAHRLGLGSWLGRWGFTVLAVVALANGLQLPCLICTAIAIYAWRSR
ncbi:hypothetical protein ACFCYB_00230 [Streptomyces sp. NPDC056309]|uniref:hypothetical protein n=1 Tax=Streptomyces sp. NPDC056309 TaxID=3345781 RepID=UPI0035E0C4B2